uniref:Calponin-homology (CH) domain-containing protein n=1 Tax=Callorhinchus milii TaxID=7868 RepID=A0A4W3GNR1_CALMI
QYIIQYITHVVRCCVVLCCADERDAVQKKTFTKWMNSHLSRVSCRSTDLYSDLRDGYTLTRLLEVLSGEQLPKPTRGRMRIHSLENVDKALQFLKEQKVHLENTDPRPHMDHHPPVSGQCRPEAQGQEEALQPLQPVPPIY